MTTLSNEKYIWYKSYDPGVPHTINPDKYHSIADLLEQSYQGYRSSLCFVNFGEHLNFQQVNELSHAYAGYLQKECGLVKGDRIAIIMPNLLQYPVVLSGIFLAGLVAVNVRFLYTSEEIHTILKETGVKCVQILSNFAHLLEPALPGTEVKHVIVTQIGDLFDFPKDIVFNLAVKYIKKAVPKWKIPGYIPFLKTLKPRYAKLFQKVELEPHDLAVLAFTEARTTGIPKCIMLSHRNLIASTLQTTAWAHSFFRHQYKEPVLGPLPFFAMASVICNFIVPVRMGITSHLITDPRDIPLFVKEIENHPFSGMVSVRTLFNALLENKIFCNLNFSKLKFVFSGGMSTPKTLAKKWEELTHTTLIQGYSLEEATGVAMINPLSSNTFTGYAGLPLSSMDAKICDHHGNTLAVGETGEIWIKGPQIMLGYWNQPEKTKEVLTEDGWFKTGDIGYMNADGYFMLLERKEDLIYTSHGIIYPHIIEGAILELNGIEEAVVVGGQSNNHKSVIKAFVKKIVPGITTEDIRNHCIKRLEDYQIPHEIEFKETWPLSPIGFILRRVLREEAMKE